MQPKTDRSSSPSSQETTVTEYLDHFNGCSKTKFNTRFKSNFNRTSLWIHNSRVKFTSNKITIMDNSNHTCNSRLTNRCTSSSMHNHTCTRTNRWWTPTTNPRSSISSRSCSRTRRRMFQARRVSQEARTTLVTTTKDIRINTIPRTSWKARRSTSRSNHSWQRNSLRTTSKAMETKLIRIVRTRRVTRQTHNPRVKTTQASSRSRARGSNDGTRRNRLTHFQR